MRTAARRRVHGMDGSRRRDPSGGAGRRADPLPQDSRTIQELLLDAVGDARGWNGVLRHLAGLLSAPLALLEVHPPAGEDRPPCILGACGVEARYQGKYLTAFSVRNPWMLHGRSRFRSGAVLSGDRIVRRRDLIKTEFHSGFLRPQGMLHLLLGVLSSDEDGLATVVFLRGRDAGPFTGAEISLLRAGMPGVQKALKAHLELGKVRHNKGTAQEVLDRVRVGVVVLDRHGKALSMNRRAREILEQREALALTSGRLKCLHPEDARAFNGAMKKALREGELGAGRVAEVMGVRRGGAGPPLHLLIFPVCTGSAGIHARCPKALAILMDSKKGEGRLSIPCLEEVFGFSPAEARFASLLGQGLSVMESARRLGIRVNTARTHLKHIFAKSRTSRQGELVRLLLGSPAACAARDGEPA